MEDRSYRHLLERAAEHYPSRTETLEIIRGALDNAANRELLFEAARNVRRNTCGDQFRLTGGISSVLPCRLAPLCLYCPYWRSSEAQQASTDEIVAAVHHFKREGIREFHLSGGTIPGSDGSELLSIVQAIWNSGIRDMEITINCGAALNVETMRRMKKMGVVKTGVVFETADRELFKSMKPGDSFSAKEKFAWDINEAGLQMHSGLMAGLGQEESRPENYTDSLIYLRQFPHMQSLYISKFRPDPSIPLKNKEQCPLDEACVLVSAARLVLRDKEIRIAAGWNPQERVSGILAGGGNELCAMMLNHHAAYWKPGDTAENYESRLEISDSRSEQRAMIDKMGLEIQ